MRKKLQRLLWVAPVAMLFIASAASAQVTGTIVGVVNDAATGKPIAGALVIATSKALQGEQTSVTDGRGQYTLTALPPGVYRLVAQLQGFKPAERTDINLRVDFTLRANISMVPESVQMEEQVVKTGTAPAVNIGSAEAGTIVSKEYLANVPTTRTYESVATIAPSAQRDAYGISFAGASSPENNYIIDGLRVSDPNTGTLGTNLLTNFIDQLDVKVGSFMPEYGYSSAGIINTVTKSGGNEFHGSIWGNLSPGFFTPSTPAIMNNGQAIGLQTTPYKGSYTGDFGFELGGPIVKDKLWFYAGFAPQYGYTARTRYYQTRTRCPADIPAGDPRCLTATGAGAGRWLVDAQSQQYTMTPIAGTEQGWNGGFSTYFAIGKLTWLINENNNVFVSFNTQPTNNYGYGTGFNGNPSALILNTDSNSTNATLNYTGKFLDKHLLLEVKGGWYNTVNTENAQTVDGVDNSVAGLVQWRSTQQLANFVNLPTGCAAGTGTGTGCVVQTYATGGTGYTDDPTNNRYSGTASLTGLFELGGQHQLKGGVQVDYSQYKNPNRRYSGNAWTRVIGNVASPSTANSTGANSVQLYRSFGSLDPNQTIRQGFSANWCTSIDANGNCVGSGQQDPNVWGLAGANTNTMTNGYFVQDSWTIANVLTLNFGVRLDTQKMENPTYAATNATAPTLSITDEWSPRVQAIWDFTGTGRGKIQGNWGMYYEAIPLDLALRALGADSFVQGYYKYSACANRDPKANPGWNPLADCNEVYGANVGQGPGPNTQNLSNSGPGFNTIGGQYTALAPNLKGAYTQQFGGGIQYEVLQDLTVGVDYMGRRLGRAIEDMSSDGGINYYIANPAVTQPWTVPMNGGPYEGQTFNPINAAANTPSGAVATVQWAVPTRSYDGFSLTVNKLFSKKWLAQASYTWSSLRGNYGGLFRSETGQLDPNITSDYDLAVLLGNKYGPLSGNKQNQIKFAGSYSATLSPDVTFMPSTQFQAFSGNPISAYTAHPDYGPGEGYMIPRGMAGNLPWTFQWDLGAKVLWAISGPYTLQFSLDIFNILNMQTVQQVDQNWILLGAAPSIQNAQCSNYTSATAKNPIAALQSACPDLPYARNVDGSRVTINPNYGQPQNTAGVAAYQVPISARFGVALSF